VSCQVFGVSKSQVKVQTQETPKLQILRPVFEYVLPQVRPDLNYLDPHKIQRQNSYGDANRNIEPWATQVMKLIGTHGYWNYESVVVDANSRVEQIWDKDPFDDLFLVGNFLQEKLNEFVVVNQLIVWARDLLEELLNISFKPLDLHDGYFKRVQLVSLKFVEEVASALVLLLNHFFKLLFYLLVREQGCLCLEKDCFGRVRHTQHLDSFCEAGPDVWFVQEVAAGQTKIAENFVEVFECVHDVVQSDFS